MTIRNRSRRALSLTFTVRTVSCGAAVAAMLATSVGGAFAQGMFGGRSGGGGLNAGIGINSGRGPGAGAIGRGDVGIGRGVNIGTGVAIGRGVQIGAGVTGTRAPTDRPPRYAPDYPVYYGVGRIPLRTGPTVIYEDDVVYESGPRAGRRAPTKSAQKNNDTRNSAQGSGRRIVPKEVVIEIDGNPTDADADQLARRYRLTRMQSQPLPLIGSTLFRWRIADNRSVDAVVRELSTNANVRSAQPNYRYALMQTPAAAKAGGDPTQYALATLRLPEAHTLTKGADVTVAVIDSMVDVSHPELEGRIVEAFDAVGGTAIAHEHGTGIAGVIAAQGRLTGSAPAARVLAIRAFAPASGGAESNSFVILKSLEFAASRNARVINMSFAGNRDALVEKTIAAIGAKGIALVAASGNAGPKSPPLYPAAYRGVIAVTATDSADRLFNAANRGAHVTLAAPGVDILAPSPDKKYQMASGTSFAAAYVSGLVALMIERNAALTPDETRTILTTTARDLGPAGRDDQFGAGKADAFAAVSAVKQPVLSPAAPVASAAPASAPATSGQGTSAPTTDASLATSRPAN